MSDFIINRLLLRKSSQPKTCCNKITYIYTTRGMLDIFFVKSYMQKMGRTKTNCVKMMFLLSFIHF